MSLIPAHLKPLMISNARRRQADDRFDPFPIVKLFAPWAAATWLLSELNPDDPDIAFGLCDLGHGFPELGEVRLSEIASLRGPLGLGVEVDQAFLATKTLSAYAYQAAQRGAIEA
jgi:Protein of unknown function (DUF2958)